MGLVQQSVSLALKKQIWFDVAVFMNISELIDRSPLMSVITTNDDTLNAIEIGDREREPLRSKWTEASVCRCSPKWIFLKNSQYLEYLLIKLQAFRQLYLKDAPTQVLSCEYCKIFKNSFFMEYLWWLFLNEDDSFTLSETKDCVSNQLRQNIWAICLIFNRQMYLEYLKLLVCQEQILVILILVNSVSMFKTHA